MDEINYKLKSENPALISHVSSVAHKTYTYLTYFAQLLLYYHSNICYCYSIIIQQVISKMIETIKKQLEGEEMDILKVNFYF